ncbi:MAG: hypothetical protein IJV15_00360 [Lachnospiraceae bacterium]|nr:hypothetical protein [Lachnospiraceae bacterium]
MKITANDNLNEDIKPEEKNEESANSSSEGEKGSANSKDKEASTNNGDEPLKNEDIEKEPPLENNLELSGLSRKERRAARKARRQAFTKDMTTKEKISYFFYYNKWKIIVAVIVIFFISGTVMTILKNSRPVALAYAVVNQNSMDYPSDEPIIEYLKYYGFDDSYQVRASTSIHLSYEEYINGTMSPNDTASYEHFPVRCSENYYDIIFSDQNGIDYCVNTYIVLPVENVLPAAMIDEINQKYPDSILGITDDKGILTNYYIDISGTNFVKKLNLTYDNVYLCFPGNSTKDASNAIKAVKFILNLDYEIN